MSGLLWEPLRGTSKVQGRSLEEPHLHNTKRFLISKTSYSIVLELHSVAFCFSKTTQKESNWQENNVVLP